MTLDELQTDLLAWFGRQGRDLPWRKTRDPYAILVAEIMLQQTQVSRVIARWTAWLERWPTVESLAAAAPADVVRAWSGLGYNRRALSLQRAARAVVVRGRFPRTYTELRELPGIGPYTASAVACFAFDAQRTALDTNVRRVLDPRARERATSRRRRAARWPGTRRSSTSGRPSAWPASRAASSARSQPGVPRAARASSRCAGRGRSRDRAASAEPSSCAICTAGRGQRRVRCGDARRLVRDGLCASRRRACVALPEEGIR